MKKLLLIPLLFLVVGLFPNVYAVHPLTENGYNFDDVIVSWCYDEPRLDNISLDNNTGESTAITNIVEVIRERISANTHLDIRVDNTCVTDGNGISSRDEQDTTVLAVTTTSYVIATGKVVNKIIYFNTEQDWTAANANTCTGFSPYPVSLTAEHEIGHFGGLSHFETWESDYPSPDTIMNDGYFCNPTELTDEDLDQISSIYPNFIAEWLKNPADWWATDITRDDEYLRLGHN